MKESANKSKILCVFFYLLFFAISKKAMHILNVGIYMCKQSALRENVCMCVLKVELTAFETNSALSEKNKLNKLLTSSANRESKINAFLSLSLFLYSISVLSMKYSTFYLFKYSLLLHEEFSTRSFKHCISSSIFLLLKNLTLFLISNINGFDFQDFFLKYSFLKNFNA